MREGSLEAPTRHPIDWQNPDFSGQAKLDGEFRRVFDICHGCRRCLISAIRFRVLSISLMRPEHGLVEDVKAEDFTSRS